MYVPPQTCSIFYAVQYQLLSPSGRPLGIMLGHPHLQLTPLSTTFHFFCCPHTSERGNLPPGHWYLLYPLSATLLSPLDPAWPLLPSNSLKKNLYHPSALNKPIGFPLLQDKFKFLTQVQGLSHSGPSPSFRPYLDLLAVRRTALLFLTLYSFIDSSP